MNEYVDWNEVKKTMTSLTDEEKQEIDIKNSGVIPDIGISISNAETFMGYSMVFPGIYENERVLFIPAELADIFTQTDGCELESIVRRNTGWIRLTHGLLYYYGVMEAWLIKGKIEELTGEKVDFSSIDVSFISLKLVLPVAKNLLKDDGEIVALIKPQFEAGRDKVGKKGIIKDSKVHKDVIRDIYDFCSSIGLFINNITFSPIKGTTGNIEYLAHIKKDSGIDKNNIDSIINTVVSESHLML